MTLTLFYLLILPHEIGHAIAGWISGHRIFSIHLGSGRRSWRFALPGTAIMVDVRPTWTGRVVFGSLLTLRQFQLRQIIFYAGGPAANLALICWAAFEMQGSDWRSDWMHRCTPWTALFFSNALLLIETLVPRYGKHVLGGRIASDGLGIYQTWRRVGVGVPLADASARRIVFASRQGESLRLLRRHAEAEHVVRSAIEIVGPNATLYQSLAYIALSRNDLDAAESHIRETLSPLFIGAASRFGGLLTLAWIQILRDDPEEFKKARRNIEQARVHSPADPALNLLDGILDTFDRRTDSAIARLLAALRTADDRETGSVIYAMLAVNAERRGHRWRAFRLIRRARRLNAAHPLVRRAEREMQESAAIKS